MRKRKKAIKETVCAVAQTELFDPTLSDPFLNQPIATETLDLTLWDDLLPANLDWRNDLNFLITLFDNELAQLDINWWFAQLEEEKSILFATLKAMQADFDLDFILSIAREIAGCYPTFVDDEISKNANFPLS